MASGNTRCAVQNAWGALDYVEFSLFGVTGTPGVDAMILEVPPALLALMLFFKRFSVSQFLESKRNKAEV